MPSERHFSSGAQRRSWNLKWRKAPSRLERWAQIDRLRFTCERAGARVHRKCMVYA
jgi:hypothetical protein